MINISQYLETIKGFYPFSDLPDHILERFCSILSFSHYSVGMTLYEKGKRGEVFYIVNTGSIYELAIAPDGEETILSVLSAGDAFGTLSLLTDESHLVTTRIKEEATLFEVPRTELNELIKEYPELNITLNRIVKNKLNQFFSFFEKEKIKLVHEREKSGEKEKELSILTKVTELMSSESPEEVFKTITDEIREVMKADMCCIFLLDSFSKELVLEVSSGKGEDSIKDARLKLGEGLTGWVVQHKEPVVVENMHTDSRVKFIEEIDEQELTSLLSVPLIERGHAIGAMNICTKEKRKFSYQEVRGSIILANHIALAVSNSRLRRKVEAISEGKKSQGGDDNFDRFVGETALLRKINLFIDSESQNDSAIIIKGEEGTGKTLMTQLIHKSSLRKNGPLIIADCQTFTDDSWGKELFGSPERHGLLELADGGTLFLKNITSLNKAVQIRLLNFLQEGKFTHVGEKIPLQSNIRIISTVSLDIEKEVGEERFNSNLYRAISESSFYMEPLRRRRRDIPIIANHIIERLNRELHKNIRKISDLGIERLLSYDWPGNILELENVLRRAVIIGAEDKILSEQIFFGIPRIEKKWEFNLFSLQPVKELLLNKLYPVIFQKIILGITILFLTMLLLGPSNSLKNPASILIWSAGWLTLFLSILFFGRIWCGICPFTLIGDQARKIISFNMTLPKWIVENSSIAATIFILFFFWAEGAFQVTYRPLYTFYLIISIPLGAIILTILYERHVWCRYFCPLGGIVGLYSIFSFLTLRANRKICLTQCHTHECYRGGVDEGCPLFLHPYGLENNQHCTLCAKCIKNCTHNSIHLPIRIPFAQSPVLDSSAYIFSILVFALCGIILVENGSLLSQDATFFIAIASRVALPAWLLYTILFLFVSLVPIAGFYLLNLLINKNPLDIIHKRIKKFGYAFIPLSLMAHIAFFLKKLIVDGGGIGYGVDTLYRFLYIGEHWFGLGLLIEMLAIFSGAVGSFYILAQIEKQFIQQYSVSCSSIKGETILLGLFTIFSLLAVHMV